jgi:predicted DNA-binding transcriptional regulator AlpA
MRVDQAASYFGMSRASFLRLVDDGVMPPPVKVRGMTMWDRYDLDDAWERLKENDGEPNENTVDRRLRELRDERRRAGGSV